ncbi:hypothetical protein [Streptomyces sp. NPDC088400]
MNAVAAEDPSAVMADTDGRFLLPGGPLALFLAERVTGQRS